MDISTITYTGLVKDFFDYIAKKYVDYIDTEVGNTEEDNSNVEIDIPVLIDGWSQFTTGYTASYLEYGLYNRYLFTDYMLHFYIDGVTNPVNFVDTYVPVWKDHYNNDITVDNAYSIVNNSGSSQERIDSAIASLDYAQEQAQTFALRLNDGMSQEKIYARYQNHGTSYYTELFTYNQNTRIFDSFTRYNIYQNPPVDITNISKIYIDSNNTHGSMAIASSAYPVETIFGFDRNYNLLFTGNNGTAQSIYNNNSSTYNNTFNYTTSNGDTLNVYYGDNYISIGTGGGDIGGGALINYNDLKLIMDDIIDDLKINVPALELPEDYLFPTYLDVKYEDMGDFYITPIEQIPKLPAVPDLTETNVDIGSPLTIIGSSITSLISLYSDFGTSALLAFVFILSVVVSRLRGD